MNERESLHYFATEIVGLTLNPAQERLVRLIDAQYDPLRVVVVRKGRRVGMTACAGLVAAWAGTVLAPRFKPHLLPDEEFTITLVATTREQATVVLGFVRRFLKSSLMLAEQVVAETNSTIRLGTGCVIEAVPCSARASRGRANGIVILDEGAHFVDSAGNASLSAVYDALRPPLAQFGDAGLMLVISTPLDGIGTFYDLDQQASSGQFRDMAALHLPTQEANPKLANEAESERLRNPRQFDREWRGEYTSGDETLPLAAFDACVDQTYEAPYSDLSTPIVLALDGSVSRDSTALIGINENWTLVYAREWKPPPNGTIDHREVLRTLVDLSLRFPIARRRVRPIADPWACARRSRRGAPDDASLTSRRLVWGHHGSIHERASGGPPRASAPPLPVSGTSRARGPRPADSSERRGPDHEVKVIRSN
jgi:hypothetical protein